MSSKLHVAVLCGGQSSEHEVSIQSAKNVIQALDATRYEVLVFFISQQGEWFQLHSVDTILQNPDYQPLPAEFPAERLLLHFGSQYPFVSLPHLTPIKVDVVFPVLHGAQGEDGTMQGLLQLANIPYVGADTLGSAVCMDKEATKRLLEAAKIPVTKCIITHNFSASDLDFDAVAQQLGLPLFVKPANTGSSVGVSKVKNREEWNRAITLAETYDAKVIVEEAILGREIECSVLGNEFLKASLPGEIIPHHEFYSYEAKYLDPDGATLVTPAELSNEIIEKIQTLAKKAFQVLFCEGMARVDFFLTPDGNLIINELNTLPGFTSISQYPKMWQVSGLPYPALIDALIGLAIERFERDKKLRNEAYLEAEALQ